MKYISISSLQVCVKKVGDVRKGCALVAGLFAVVPSCVPAWLVWQALTAQDRAHSAMATPLCQPARRSNISGQNECKVSPLGQGRICVGCHRCVSCARLVFRLHVPGAVSSPLPCEPCRVAICCSGACDSSSNSTPPARAEQCRRPR
ncbi:hypothetical protein MTO96_029932 [Rhipicephalus appendiculatus]